MPRKPDPTVGLEKRVQADGTTAYRAEVRIPGTKKKKRGHWTTNLAQARAERAKLLASQEALAAREAAPTYPTVAEALDDFLQGAEEGRPWARGGRPYAPKTVRGYQDDARLHVIPAIGEFPIDQLRRSQLQALVDRVALTYSGQKARNVATVVQALYRHLLPRHDDLLDPTHGLELPAGSKPRERVATPAELAALLDRLDPRDQAPLALAGMAGLRRGEMRALHVEDADLLGGTLHVERSWDDVEGEVSLKHRQDGEHRDVPIFPGLEPYLGDQLARLGPDVEPEDRLLPGAGRHGQRIGEGQPFDHGAWRRRAMAAWGWSWDGSEWVAGEGALEPLGFHEARHSFASWLVLLGYDVATVSDWVGHRQVSTTLDRYVKPMRRRGVSPADVRALLGHLPGEAPVGDAVGDTEAPV